MKTTLNPVQLVQGYLPTIRVEWTLFGDALFTAVCDARGGYKYDEQREVVLLQSPRGMLGDWIVTFFYDDENGVQIDGCYAAVRVN